MLFMVGNICCVYNCNEKEPGNKLLLYILFVNGMLNGILILNGSAFVILGGYTGSKNGGIVFCIVFLVIKLTTLFPLLSFM